MKGSYGRERAPARRRAKVAFGRSGSLATRYWSHVSRAGVVINARPVTRPVKVPSVVFQKCLGHSSTDASGPAALLLLEIAVLFLVVAPCRIRRLGTLGGSRTSETPH